MRSINAPDLAVEYWYDNSRGCSITQADRACAVLSMQAGASALLWQREERRALRKWASAAVSPHPWLCNCLDREHMPSLQYPNQPSQEHHETA